MLFVVSKCIVEFESVIGSVLFVWYVCGVELMFVGWVLFDYVVKVIE